MSLFESCITVAIISTATMIAVPTILQSRDNYELTAAARQVAGQLQSTRIKAIARNRDCRFRVNTAVSYVVECLESTTWLPDEFGTVPRGFTISGNAVPRFHRRGNVSPAATISVWSLKGQSRRVIVNISGRVRVE